MENKRDWLPQYTDLEILVIRKIFEMKTNMQIGHELDCSAKSINVRILNIFKKLGVRSGLASKNLILHHFGTRHAQHLEKVKNFVMPPKVTWQEKKLNAQEENNQHNALKIKFILDNDILKVYTQEHLSSVNNSYLEKIYRIVLKEIQLREENELNLQILNQACPVLPCGPDQHNGISYHKIISTDHKRILLLFPKQENHKYKHEDGRSE